MQSDRKNLTQMSFQLGVRWGEKKGWGRDAW